MLEIESPEYVSASNYILGGVPTTKVTGFDFIPDVNCQEMAALWDTRADIEPVRRYYRLLKSYDRAMKSCESWNYSKSLILQAQKNQIIRDWEKNFNDFYNDKKSGLRWFNGTQRFEPHDLVIQLNKVTWQGLAHFLKIGSGQTSIYYEHMEIGKGTATFIPYNRQTLFDPLVRISSRQFGDINTDGNVFKMSAPFPTNVETANITEYGGFTKATGGIMFFIAIAAKALAHILGVTFVQATHHVIFVTRTA